MRTTSVRLQATTEERDLIDRAARSAGVSRSAFIVEAACGRAQEVLLDQVLFRIDSENFQKFSALLDAAPTANAGLLRLLRLKAPWV